MADNSKIIEALELFNKKAVEVTSSSMIRALKEHGTGKQFDDDGNIEKTHGPTMDQINAFILDFRFFIQDNERCSFRNLSKLYQDAPVDNQIKVNFESARTYLQTYLIAPGSDQQYDGKRITSGELLDVFLYGTLAHSNRAKEEVYKAWMSDPVFAAYVEHDFVWTLSGLCFVINYVKEVNRQALSQLRP